MIQLLQLECKSRRQLSAEGNARLSLSHLTLFPKNVDDSALLFCLTIPQNRGGVGGGGGEFKPRIKLNHNI